MSNSSNLSADAEISLGREGVNLRAQLCFSDLVAMRIISGTLEVLLMFPNLYLSEVHKQTMLLSLFEASSFLFIGEDRITVISPGWLMICFTFKLGCFLAASQLNRAFKLLMQQCYSLGISRLAITMQLGVFVQLLSAGLQMPSVLHEKYNLWRVNSLFCWRRGPHWTEVTGQSSTFSQMKSQQEQLFSLHCTIALVFLLSIPFAGILIVISFQYTKQQDSPPFPQDKNNRTAQQHDHRLKDHPFWWVLLQLAAQNLICHPFSVANTQSNTNHQQIMPPTHQKSKSSFGESSGQVNKGEVLFKRKVESISQYIDVLDSNPEEASRVENIWQKDFYKNELKVALTLNHNLVKILGEKQLQIKELFLQISQLQKKMPRAGQEKQSFCRINIIQNENSQNEANKGNSTPKRQFKEAYQAERKILGAKHSQQKEEYQKLMEKKEEILRSNKEENVYLLDKLLSLGEQLSSFQQENHGLKKQNKELRKSMKIEVNREDNCERKLNFSLISVDNEEEVGQKEVQEIFLSQIETTSKSEEKQILKRQIESLKAIIQEHEQRQSKPESQPSQKPKMKYYEALHQNFLQLQKELTEKEEEIVEYRAIFAQFNEHQHHFRRQSERSSILQTEITILKKTIQEYEIKCSEQEFQTKQEEKWLECLKLQNANDNLTLELQQVSSSNTSLKVLLEKMFNLSQTQQKQWNICFEGIGKGKQC